MSGDLMPWAEDLRCQALVGLDSTTQDRLGQFFTPQRAAEMVAAMPRLPDCDETIRVLDPGAGSGILVAALVERLAAERPGCSVHVTAVEVDEQLIAALEATVEQCRQWAARRGMSLIVDVRREDFIESTTGLWSADVPDTYDLVIMNPPYAKLSSGSPPRRVLLDYGVDCPNLYAAFLAMGILLLKPGGQLVAITPRSFANGPYFERFRKFLLRSLTLDRIHVFESRSTVFSDTGVLQENLVLSGTKGADVGTVRLTTWLQVVGSGPVRTRTVSLHGHRALVFEGTARLGPGTRRVVSGSVCDRGKIRVMSARLRARVPLDRSIPHPIPYQGSKRALAPKILGYLPDGTETLFEPFAGSAAVTLAAVRSGSCQKALISDLNEPLVRLWSSIMETPALLASQYEELWHQQLGREQDFYYEIRDRFNASGSPHHFLYLLARCVKSAVRYNSRGEFNQSPDKRRRGAKPATIASHVNGASETLQSVCRAMCADYRKVLSEVGPADVVYLDPPYQGVSGNRDKRYIAGMLVSEFLLELEKLNDRGISFILSYDGRTGSKTYGDPIPVELGLTHIEVDAGRSSSATLLGRDDRTIESLYLSPALVGRLGESATMTSPSAALF